MSDLMDRSVMHRLLDAAGWDAGSIRHKQLEDALDGAALKIVPTDINQFEVTSDGVIDWKAEAETLVKALEEALVEHDYRTNMNDEADSIWAVKARAALAAAGRGSE